MPRSRLADSSDDRGIECRVAALQILAPYM